MFKNLNPGAIGVALPFEDSARLAAKHGFEGIEAPIAAIVDQGNELSVERVAEILQSLNLRAGGWGLPVNWRADEQEYREGLKQLRRFAEVAQRLDSPWVATWVPPVSDSLPFQENFQFHVERFRPCAEILAEHGCRLGLEFIGPKTLRQNAKYEFIYTLEGMLELCEAIGTGNVGLLLDCWHWYTSGGTVETLQRLTADNVVYVHINDAPAGVPVDEQIDNVRCLPGETGVIDIRSFLRRLAEVGFDGPVTPEPFRKDLAQMPPEEAVRLTAESVHKVWQQAGLK